MAWHQIGARTSATTILPQLWLKCHKNHITQYIYCITNSVREAGGLAVHWFLCCYQVHLMIVIKHNMLRPQQVNVLSFLMGSSPHVVGGRPCMMDDCTSNLQSVDAFTVPLHSPNGRHLPAIRAVQGDCQWSIKWHKFPSVTWTHNT